jgi:hypothetical protein
MPGLIWVTLHKCVNLRRMPGLNELDKLVHGVKFCGSRALRGRPHRAPTWQAICTGA